MYKELVEKLRHRGTLYNGISLFDDAANAIEKLLFKYNFANMTKKETEIALKNEFLKSSKLEAENKQLRHERDQAVEELHRNTDAVPVVRCKDCIKWEADESYEFDDDGTKKLWVDCSNSLHHCKDNHYCSYGERKESNE